MRVTIKYSMAVAEGMRRFFFPLLSSLCLRQPPRDPQPGGLAAGRAQRRRRTRTQPGPGPPRPAAAAARLLPPPGSCRRPTLHGPCTVAPRRRHGAEAGAPCAEAQVARPR